MSLDILHRRRNLDAVSPSNDPDITSLYHYYPFESDVNDDIGTAHGTANNITYGSGLYGTGANFNGTSSSIILPQNVLAESTEFSLTGLFKTNVANSTEMRVIAFSNNGAMPYILLRLNAGVANRIDFRVQDGVDNVMKTVDGYDLTQGVHIGVTAVENDRYRVYVNGNLEVEDSTFGSFAAITPANNTLGASRFANAQYQNGMQRGFGVWSTALTEANMLKVANKQLAGNQLI